MMSSPRLISHLTAAAALLATVATYFYEVVPLRERNERLQQSLRATREARARDWAQIRQAREREQETAGARAEISRLLGYLHEGSAAVEMPLLAKKHFHRFSFEASVVRLNALRNESGLQHCQTAYLGVGVPVERGGQDVAGLLLAVAELEDQNKFVRIVDFSLGPDAEDPRRLMGGFNFSALVRE